MFRRLEEHYTDVFFSERTERIMRAGNIIPDDGTAQTTMDGLCAALKSAERTLQEDRGDTVRVLDELQDYTRRGLCTLGSPLLTNIAYGHRAFGSCAAVPLGTDALSAADLDLAETYYQLNMGSGYNLTDSADPCQALTMLNEHAMAVEASGSCERYVGNIAHVAVSHPRILDFISFKTDRGDIVHFNTSVDVSEEFMTAVEADGEFSTEDGARYHAREIWDAITRAAWRCGDPGLISLERYNSGNALAGKFSYTTTAPCAEVGLSPGESCVFGYLNLAACIRQEPTPHIDLDTVGAVTECLTRVLDDAVELTIGGLPHVVSSSTMATKRKIGIGVCGFADALLWLGVDYGSVASAELLSDALATINYRSKLASLALARRRGPFTAFGQSAYASTTAFLGRFGKTESVVSGREWCDLARSVQRHGLRNVMTTALPPSGRSALMLDVNPSIEPYLKLTRDDGYVRPVQMLLDTGRAKEDASGVQLIGNAGQGTWPQAAASETSLFRTAVHLSPDEHFRILEVAAGTVDDGVSKTVNLSSGSGHDDVSAVFKRAWAVGMKAISVYRTDNRQREETDAPGR